MLKKCSITLLLSVALLVVLPVASLAYVTGWSNAIGGTRPIGEAITMDSRPYLTAIDTAPGYWISIDRSEAIVATQQKDGTLLAYQLLTKDDGVWGKPTLIER